jgi:hypothetical protein
LTDRGAESESSTTSMHPSLGRPYTPSLPDDSSDADADADADANSLCKDYAFRSEFTEFQRRRSGLYQLETTKSNIHRTPVTPVAWIDLPVTDTLDSSITKVDES